MRIGHWLRLIIGSFVVIFIIITLFSLLIPSQVRISRAMNVKAEFEDIRQPIADLRLWQNWNPFMDSIDASSIHYIPDAISVPASMKANQVSVTWLQSNDSLLLAEMKGMSDRKIISGWQLIHHQGSDSTVVQWYMDFKLKWYPWEKFSSLLIENAYGPAMEKGLNRLKDQLQHKEETNP